MSAATIQSPPEEPPQSGPHVVSEAEQRRRRDRLYWEPSYGKLLRHPDDGWVFAEPFPFPEATRKVFHKLARALCPPAPAPNSPEIFDQIEDDVRRALRYMHPTFAVGLIGMIHALDVAPLVTLKSFKRLQDMERADASRFLTWLGKTPIGSNLVFAGRMTILSMYFDQDEVQEAIGYRPRPFMEERIALRKRLLAGADPADEDLVGPWSDTVASEEG